MKRHAIEKRDAEGKWHEWLDLGEIKTAYAKKRFASYRDNHFNSTLQLVEVIELRTMVEEHRPWDKVEEGE